MTKIKKDFGVWVVRPMRKEGGAWELFIARSLVTFFPLDFGERSLAEIDKTLKGHLVRAHFLQDTILTRE